jgi:pyridoxal phosphate enzyme (YggS family)
MTEQLASRLAAVRRQIDDACRRAGRESPRVRLVAVSKFHPIEAIRAAYQLGLRDFGENYAQDLAERAAALRDLADIRWHFIGGFQKNKAKLLVQSGCLVQSVASEAHAKALDSKARELGRVVTVLIQVNVAQEAQKSGVEVARLGPLVETVRACSALDLQGLMVIPPAEDESRARDCYRQLRTLAQQFALPELSMGMSDDFPLAIEEGATIVRVGTAIFGARPAP